MTTMDKQQPYFSSIDRKDKKAQRNFCNTEPINTNNISPNPDEKIIQAFIEFLRQSKQYNGLGGLIPSMQQQQDYYFMSNKKNENSDEQKDFSPFSKTPG